MPSALSLSREKITPGRDFREIFEFYRVHSKFGEKREFRTISMARSRNSNLEFKIVEIGHADDHLVRWQVKSYW